MKATEMHAPTLRALIRELEAEAKSADEVVAGCGDFPLASERWQAVAKRLRQHIRMYRNRATRAEKAAAKS